MRFGATYGRLRLAALIAGLLAAVTGCVFDDIAPCVRTDEAGQFRMSITVVTNSSAATRASHDDDFEEDGSNPENYIDFGGNDFRLVFFDKNGSWLNEMDGTGKWTVFPSPSGDCTYYQMECEIEFPESVSQAEREDIRKNGVQVMAIANWQNSGSAYDGLFSKTGGHQTLDEIWKDGASYNFDYKPSADGAGSLTWRPDNTGAAKKLIPMFGIANTGAFTDRANTGGLYSGVTIPMQRAVAKIEVIDNLAQDGISVDEVTMTDYSTSGRFIPDVEANSGWNAIGSQVESSSLPGQLQTGMNLKFFHEQNSNTWVAYVPEMALESLTDSSTGEITDDRTHLNVKIKGNLDSYQGDTYSLHFAKYDALTPTVPDDSWNHILRNHIYRFSINKVGINADLHLHVIPWVKDEDEEWDFTDHVTIQQSLKWVKDSYESIDEEDGRIMLWIDRDKILAGEFVISTPVNGRWYARLVPLDGANPNAVTFTDAKGDVMEPSAGVPPVCSEVSGIIEQERPAKIYIRPTGFGNEDQSNFRIEFFVENLGTWMEVPMTDDDKYKYYTIVRKGNRLE